LARNREGPLANYGARVCKHSFKVRRHMRVSTGAAGTKTRGACTPRDVEPFAPIVARYYSRLRDTSTVLYSLR